MSILKKGHLLTEEDISKLEDFDVPALEEGIRQVELGMLDARATKESLDKKTFSLLTIYIAFSTIALTIASEKLISIHLSDNLLGPGFLFGAGSLFLLSSLWNGDYGALGRYPDTWLISSDFVEGKNKQYGYTLAIVLRQYQDRIEKSDRRNKTRASLINWGILCGIIAPFGILSPYFFPGTISVIFCIWAIIKLR